MIQTIQFIKGLMNLKIVNIRKNPEYLEKGIDYFSKKWGIDRKIYADCITNCITTNSPIPRWYLMMKQGGIIGSYGLITNDFISRQDLFPWFCALFIEEKERGKELGKTLLTHGRREASKLGYKKLYIATDIQGYYEKYSWEYIATGYHPWGAESRIYEIRTIP